MLSLGGLSVVENMLLLTEPNLPCKQKEVAHVCHLQSAAVTGFLGAIAIRLETGLLWWYLFTAIR